jgi:predicted O-methyltransferase YrrM
MRALAARVQALEATIEQLTGQVPVSPYASPSARTTFSAGLLLGRGIKLGDRVIGQAAFDTLVGELVEATRCDEESTRRQLHVAYRALLLAEARSLGRIAGSTVNILGKLVAPRLLGPPNGRVLEIGTLYGVFGGALAHELARAGLDVDLTVIDPLEGVQLQTGKGRRTDVSGTPVSEPVVRWNLEASGLDAYRILRGYSTDREVRDHAGDRSYGVIVLDGDHSEAGVAADLEWVEHLVEPGSVIVLDDYGDQRWPGVKRAADAHLARSGRLRSAGVVATSGYVVAT